MCYGSNTPPDRASVLCYFFYGLAGFVPQVAVCVSSTTQNSIKLNTCHVRTSSGTRIRLTVEQQYRSTWNVSHSPAVHPFLLPKCEFFDFTAFYRALSLVRVWFFISLHSLVLSFLFFILFLSFGLPPSFIRLTIG